MAKDYLAIDLWEILWDFIKEVKGEDNFIFIDTKQNKVKDKLWTPKQDLINRIISKEYWFIEWLIGNDYITMNALSIINVCDWELNRDLTLTDLVVMWLSIQKNPLVALEKLVFEYWEG